MNALERTFINKTIKTAVNTLENENFGFKRIYLQDTNRDARLSLLSTTKNSTKCKAS